jgi:DNA sulfur modification protein DndD
MRDVDDVYRSQINDAGGYGKFLQSCLNRMAYREDTREFSVSMTFVDVDIPSFPCHEIKITRTGYFNSGSDDLTILIDGHENELTREVGDDIFIHDFILPKEIAKFFFFDSEKIVSLAEMKSLADKRQLSKAYSEVLGIKKYEDLRKNLKDLTLRFRKGSANPQEQAKFELLSRQLETLKNTKIDYKIELEKLEDGKAYQKKISSEIQEKLIRLGSSLTVDEINNLKIEKYRLQKEIEELKEAFKELLDLAPFAIAGDLFSAVKCQLDTEKSLQEESANQEILSQKGEELLRAFKLLAPNPELNISEQIEKYFQEHLDKLVHTILIGQQQKSEELRVLHSFTDEEYNELNSIYLQLKTSYANRVKEISKSLRNNRLEYGRISRQLSDAESKETDGVISKYRREKQESDKELLSIEERINVLHQEIGSCANEIANKSKVLEELAKKIKVHERYIEKDKLAERLIGELDDFLINIKQEKKVSLEKRILRSMQNLMHKKSFVENVSVSVDNDIIDIHLFNARGEEINKDMLSKGEQQLYATSILKALVEESNIDFPVFIDSPLQKFDARHAKNIIAEFYPAISKQVVLLPLLNKEMTQEEYDLLEDKVQAAYLIHNENEDVSHFLSVNPFKLFEAAKKLHEHVF